MTPVRRPARPSRDTGLGLVEVVVAMLVLTVALLALIPVQTWALAGVVLAEERQQATAYANQAIERVRARTAIPAGFTAVAAGRAPTSADAIDVANTTGCASTCTFRPAFDPTLTETLLISSTPDLSLATTRCSEASGCVTTGSVTGSVFTTHLYVTATGDARLVTVTAITSWVSGARPDGRRQVAVRTQVAAEAGP